MATTEQIIKALKENTEYMKKLRDDFEERNNKIFAHESHLIWYWLACSLDGTSFKP